jgi:ketosteroid isomerase-like protein
MAELADQDVEAIKDIHDRWIAKELEGNSSQLVDFCTNDIQWILPDARPVVGKEAVANYLDAFKVEIKEAEVTDLWIRGSDSLAYLTSNYRSRFLTEGTSEMHEVAGTHLWLLRKTQRGDWRVAVVAWSFW